MLFRLFSRRSLRFAKREKTLIFFRPRLE